jgi:hypothetical protein
MTPVEPSLDTPPWVEHGVLVYGPRKAGTTLFQHLLDGGDQVFVYPQELKVKWFIHKPERARDIEKYIWRSRISRVDSPHLSQERYRELWAAAREQRTLQGLADFIRYDAQAVFASCTNAPVSVEMWCAKEVGGPTMEVLDTWRRMFPGSKALFITRNPLMATRAVLNHRRRNGVRLSLREIAFQTYDPMRVVTAQSRLLADSDIFLIAYEDLIADTAGVMAGVADFLGVSRTPKFEAPTIFSEPVIVRTASRQTTEVFQPAASWREGLTWREQLTVAAVSRIASLMPRFNVNYAALRRRLRQRSRPS